MMAVCTAAPVSLLSAQRKFESMRKRTRQRAFEPGRCIATRIGLHYLKLNMTCPFRTLLIWSRNLAGAALLCRISLEKCLSYHSRQFRITALCTFSGRIQQIYEISSYHGLVSFIVHPDYLSEPKDWELYSELLKHIRTKQESNLWIALPGQINTWWRQRNNMERVRTHAGWTIEGEGSEAARVAFARIVNNDIVYSFQPQALEVTLDQQLLV